MVNILIKKIDKRTFLNQLLPYLTVVAWEIGCLPNIFRDSNEIPFIPPQKNPSI